MGWAQGIEGFLKSLLGGQQQPPQMPAPQGQAAPPAAPPQAPQMQQPGGLTGLLSNPLVSGALGAYFNTIAQPRRLGWGHALGMGGLGGLQAFQSAEEAQRKAPLEQAQLEETQARVPYMQAQTAQLQQTVQMRKDMVDQFDKSPEFQNLDRLHKMAIRSGLMNGQIDPSLLGLTPIQKEEIGLRKREIGLKEKEAPLAEARTKAETERARAEAAKARLGPESQYKSFKDPVSGQVHTVDVRRVKVPENWIEYKPPTEAAGPKPAEVARIYQSELEKAKNDYMKVNPPPSGWNPFADRTGYSDRMNQYATSQAEGAVLRFGLEGGGPTPTPKAAVGPRRSELGGTHTVDVKTGSPPKDAVKGAPFTGSKGSGHAYTLPDGSEDYYYD